MQMKLQHRLQPKPFPRQVAEMLSWTKDEAKHQRENEDRADVMRRLNNATVNVQNHSTPPNHGK